MEAARPAQPIVFRPADGSRGPRLPAPLGQTGPAHRRPAALKMLDTVMGPSLYEPHRPYGAPGNWSHNPEDWDRMRLAVLRAVAASRNGKAAPWHSADAVFASPSW